MLQDLNKKVSDYATELFSGANFRKLQEKTELLMTYAKNVAESTSLINQITRPIATNFFTSDIRSPTSAALNYNKLSLASQSAFARAISITRAIYEPQAKMANIFKQKGKLLGEYSNTSTY